jgi:hypothetical protein
MTFALASGTAPPDGKRISFTGYVYPPGPLPSSSTSLASSPRALNDAEGERSANGYEEVYALVGDMPDGYVLREPVSVYVTFVGMEFVAEQPRLDVSAFGDSVIEAVMNLRERIVEHYRRLEGQGDRLSPRLKEQRRLMHGLLLRKDA